MVIILSLIFCFLFAGVSAKLPYTTLMNEVRCTPSPTDGQHVKVTSPALMWPDKYPHLGPVLDGVDEHNQKPRVTYKVRLANDSDFTQHVMTATREWAFFNPFVDLTPGTWYWQHAFVDKSGNEEWSPVYHFIIDEDARKSAFPDLKYLLERLPSHHPRVLMDKSDWNRIIAENLRNPEAQLFIKHARKALNNKLKNIDEAIDTSKLAVLTNSVQRKSYLIRESRKIVDREEANVEALVRAYLLTKDRKYAAEALSRVKEIISWKNSKNFAGDFNASTLLAISTSAYDAFYDLLEAQDKALLLNSIRENGNIFFDEFVNHLENRIADNHLWQMTFRILTMGAFASYGDLPEANTWVDYCYNMWVARFPGLNDDGGWHNGDSYFTVNARTLIEVPAFYSRITGFDFFSDPWYNNNVNYVIYQQPPFSKSAGHGNAHESKLKPEGVRIGYADALSRECQNSFAADYVQRCLAKDSTSLLKTFLGKSGGLAWYRLTTKHKPAKVTNGLAQLPMLHVFPQTGLATMHTNLGDPMKNAMLSFRSSPYGSTSHALANQNSFNTFYGGQPIFYSSGHRTGFTDDHCMYAYRNTRAHNDILINGMGQKIGTEGYGWIPQYYEGEHLTYFVGDASNAYGEVTSPLWLERAKLSGTKFTPENGWDKDRLKTFRRHVVQLGKTGIFVLYDELEATEPVSFSYLLHTTQNPMTLVKESNNAYLITGTNSKGVAKAHLYGSSALQTEMTTKFFSPAVNWLNKTDATGKTIVYKDQWHFSATTTTGMKARFLTIMDIHDKKSVDRKVIRRGDAFYVGDWVIRCNLTEDGDAALSVENAKEKISLSYPFEEGKTKIQELKHGEIKDVILSDFLPDFEI